MNIILYQEDINNEVIERFINNVVDAELEFLASDLKKFGFNDMDQIGNAVERAIRVCHVTSIPVRENFRSVYISDEGSLICDWKLSPLARKLVIMNGDTSNPFVAKVQVELIKSERIDDEF